WDAATGLPLGEPFRGHTSSVNSVSFSPDGTRVVSGSFDSTVRLWDAATGLPLGEPFRGHTESVNSVSFSPDGTRIVSGSWDSTVRLWDAATGLPLGEPFRGHTSSVYSVSFSPDGTRIVSGSYDSTVRLWDVVMGQQFQEHTEIPIPTNTSNNHDICFASDLEYTLPNSAELFHDHLHSTLLSQTDGWMVGADDRLLFWVPPTSREQPFHSPGTVFVIPSVQQIDLSRMAHGEHWSNCRDISTCR
ncbi:WD40 repeat-like protein, partial [Suillus decipiens]